MRAVTVWQKEGEPVARQLRPVELGHHSKQRPHVSVEIVHFYETNPGRVVYTAHNRGVVARWQFRNDRRFRWIGRSVAAVLNISYLVPV